MSDPAYKPPLPTLGGRICGTLWYYIILYNILWNTFSITKECKVIKETSQLTGKTYEDSDYTLS